MRDGEVQRHRNLPRMFVGMFSRITGVARASAAVAALLTSLLAPCAVAQSIAGRVGSAPGAAPLPGATVVVLDSAGTLLAGATTDDAGRFTLALRAAGTYRLKVRHIGFAPDSAVVHVRAHERAVYDAVLQPFTVRLSDVVVTHGRRCTISPRAGAAAVRLWSETQSALTATAVGEAAAREFVLERFERERDPATGAVRRETRWRAIAPGGEPYHSISADSLAVHGFVVPAGDSLVFYAPDARTLISDAFTRGHCFSPARDAAHPGLVGLAFTPARAEHGRADVSGTLWLDQESAELRLLEFSFTPVVSQGAQPNGVDAPAATGEVRYRRDSSGSWIVGDWMIRMPIVAYHAVLAPEDGTKLDQGMLMRRSFVAAVQGVIEAGGHVLGIANTRMAAPLSRYGVVAGRFTDTATTAAPYSLGGIVVTLRSSMGERSARTDSIGAYRIDSVVPGRYVLQAHGGVLDTLNAAFPARSLDVRPAGELSLVAVLPSRALSIARLCGDASGRGSRTVHGTVRDAATGQPVAGALVTASWFSITGGGALDVTRATRRYATTDSAGRYVLCELPMTALNLGARHGTLIGPIVDVPASGGALRLVPLVIGERGD